ncbi:hypothetical protein QYM36_006508 [Artemia franciscana]|uniref:A to I editase domain-containing protein n=1 Tax=Artemia franciscana TaxID=6661 RepID=A0AA88HXP0_ARTSF|nr:hypothetical protein QYM36_006508 [Artemia franciscana]
MCITDKYSAVFNDKKIPKVLAGLALERPGYPLEALCIATGTNFLSDVKLERNGEALIDLHAEILVKRCFKQYLFTEIDSSYEKEKNIPKVLAGLALQRPGQPLEALCVATGTKFLLGVKLENNGEALLDLHAEILVKRLFKEYLFTEIDFGNRHGFYEKVNMISSSSNMYKKNCYLCSLYFMCITDKYSAVFNDKKIPKVLAGLALERPGYPLEALCIPTGTNFLSDVKLERNGEALIDLHAEILVKRCFKQYLFTEIDSSYEKEKNIPKVLAGLALQRPGQPLEALCVATGTKFLSGVKLENNGEALLDLHAEILVKRLFKECITDKYSAVFNDKKIPKVLAGLALKGPGYPLEALCIATGTKFLSDVKLERNGEALIDLHAEILVKRCFKQYLLTEIDSSYEKGVSPTNILLCSMTRRYQRCITDKYSAVFSDKKIPKVLAGLALERPGYPLEALCIATGTKFLSDVKLERNGEALIDLHAEILVKRCFKQYLFTEIDSSYEKGEKH